MIARHARSSGLIVVTNNLPEFERPNRILVLVPASNVPLWLKILFSHPVNVDAHFLTMLPLLRRQFIMLRLPCRHIHPLPLSLVPGGSCSLSSSFVFSLGSTPPTSVVRVAGATVVADQYSLYWPLAL